MDFIKRCSLPGHLCIQLTTDCTYATSVSLKIALSNLCSLTRVPSIKTAFIWIVEYDTRIQDVSTVNFPATHLPFGPWSPTVRPQSWVWGTELEGSAELSVGTAVSAPLPRELLACWCSSSSLGPVLVGLWCLPGESVLTDMCACRE